MLIVTTVAKAIAAVLAVILGSGIITGRWFTDTELILSIINGVVVYLVPNRVVATRVPAGRVPPATTV